MPWPTGMPPQVPAEPAESALLLPLKDTAAPCNNPWSAMKQDPIHGRIPARTGREAAGTARRSFGPKALAAVPPTADLSDRIAPTAGSYPLLAKPVSPDRTPAWYA